MCTPLYFLIQFNPRKKLTMARGQQKIQSQQKAQEKAKAAAKGNGPHSRETAKAALKWQCAVCKVWHFRISFSQI